MIKVYGASDDLIEIDGDLQEEFNVYLEDAGDYRLLAFSDGTLLRVTYDADGLWRLNRLVEGSSQSVKEDGDVETDRGDCVTFTDEIKWVVLGKESAIRKQHKARRA